MTDPSDPLNARLRALGASLRAPAPPVDVSGLRLLLKPEERSADHEEWRTLTTHASTEDEAFAEYMGRLAWSGVQAERGRKGAQISKIGRAVKRAQDRRDLP